MNPLVFVEPGWLLNRKTHTHTHTHTFSHRAQSVPNTHTQFCSVWGCSHITSCHQLLSSLFTLTLSSSLFLFPLPDETMWCHEHRGMSSTERVTWRSASQRKAAFSPVETLIFWRAVCLRCLPCRLLTVQVSFCFANASSEQGTRKS